MDDSKNTGDHNAKGEGDGKHRPGKPHKGKVMISKKLLWKHFKQFYRFQTGKDFIETPDTLDNIAPVIDYFSHDADFFTRKRLITKVGVLSLRPSFRKGLLIVGGYGNGKTTIMRSLGMMFQHFQMPMKYAMYNTHDLVSEYERIGSDPTYRESSKYQFYEKLTKVKGLYLDDVKKERVAYNFGKVNVIRDVLEKRYDTPGVKTYLTCNYREGDSIGDLEDALEEFGERYGGHVYDRLFALCNIIEFKEKTHRR